MKVVKVECKNPFIKQAIEEDVTLFEAIQSMNHRLAKNKDFSTVSIMLNALFLEQKTEEVIIPSNDPLLFKKQSALLKQKTAQGLQAKNQ
jgi:hypothetical protein